MKRLEDRLKDHFDHFQPEVDPGVWQQLSQQLPGGPALPAGKGVFSAAGGKAVLIAVGLAAVVTAGVVLYKVLVSDNETIQPSPTTTSEQVIQEPAKPREVVHEEIRTSSTREKMPDMELPRTDLKSDPASSQKSTTAAEGPTQTIDKTAGQTALTGQTGPEKGGATAVPPAPVERSKAPASTGPPTVSTQSTPDELTGNTNSATSKPVLIVSSSRGFAPLTVTFMTSMEGQTADFDFGDGNATYGKFSATHRYEENGVFEVACVIQGEVLQATVTVSGRIPSAFSPNGDGINDRFTIDNPEKTLLDLRIFNRSGQLVFSGKGADLFWDGRLPSGDPAPEGTYLVHILGPSFEGATRQQKGTIQLFR